MLISLRANLSMVPMKVNSSAAARDPNARISRVNFIATTPIHDSTAIVSAMDSFVAIQSFEQVKVPEPVAIKHKMVDTLAPWNSIYWEQTA